MSAIDRKALSRFYGWLRHIRTWQLVVILVLALVTTAALLRMNSIRMDALRSAVYTADHSGDTEGIKRSLVELQNYISHHMNTSLGKGVYLEHSYSRDRDAAMNAATSATNPKAAVYQQASVECRARFTNTGQTLYSSEYVACVVERLKALGAGTDEQPSLVLPLPENYHYNFASPFISLDAAGFGVLFCVLITSVILLRFVAGVILRFILKHRFTSI